MSIQAKLYAATSAAIRKRVEQIHDDAAKRHPRMRTQVNSELQMLQSLAAELAEAYTVNHFFDPVRFLDDCGFPLVALKHGRVRDDAPASVIPASVIPALFADHVTRKRD